MAPAEVIAHSSHRPFVGRAAGYINSDFSSFLVSQGSELLSCVILVKPRYCACLFWCQTGYTVVVSNSLMRAARTSDVSRVCRAVGHRPSNGSLCTRVLSFQTRARVLLSRTRSPTMFLCALLTNLFLQRRCWAEMCLQARSRSPGRKSTVCSSRSYLAAGGIRVFR